MVPKLTMRPAASLAERARALRRAWGKAGVAAPGGAGALTYLFKSPDLIPDGIEDLGFIDDAFVFRMAAAAAIGFEPEARGKDHGTALERLAARIEEARKEGR